jgi:hypothetical protein
MGHKGKKMQPGRARHGRVATKPNEPAQRPSRFLRVSPLFGIFALALFMASSGANAQTITAPAAVPTVTATTMATLPGVIGVAASPTLLVAVNQTDCDQVFSVSGSGHLSLFATVPVTNAACFGPSQYGGLEPAIAISGGQGGFPCNEVYLAIDDDVGSTIQAQIYQINPDGTHVQLFATLPGAEGDMGIIFDNVGTFNHSMIVTSSFNGEIWVLGPQGSSHGTVAPWLKLTKTVIEGPWVAPMSFGKAGGDMFIASQKYWDPVNSTYVNGVVLAITPSGASSIFASWNDAESIAFDSASNLATFENTGAALIIADQTDGLIEELPASDFVNHGGQGFVDSEDGAGIAAIASTGTTSLFAPTSAHVDLEVIAFVTQTVCHPCSPCGGQSCQPCQGWGQPCCHQPCGNQCGNPCGNQCGNRCGSPCGNQCGNPCQNGNGPTPCGNNGHNPCGNQGGNNCGYW